MGRTPALALAAEFSPGTGKAVKSTPGAFPPTPGGDSFCLDPARRPPRRWPEEVLAPLVGGSFLSTGLVLRFSSCLATFCFLVLSDVNPCFPYQGVTFLPSVATGWMGVGVCTVVLISQRLCGGLDLR